MKSIMKKYGITACIFVLTAMMLGGCSSIGISKELKESMQNNGFAGNPKDYVELGQYKGLSIDKGTHEVTEEELQEELDYLVTSCTTYEDVTSGAVEVGDKANIDYCGKIDGVAFDGGTAEGSELEIGSHTFIAGFEDGLIGVETGETVDLSLTFPEDYYSEKLAGKDVIFTVTVNSISRPSVPELTDAFIQEISSGQFTTIDEYKKAVSEEIKAEYDAQYETQYKEDLWNAAVDNATVKKDIPGEFTENLEDKNKNNLQKYADSYGIDFDSFVSMYMGLSNDEFNAQLDEYSQKAAKESLVLWAIADAEGITVSQEEIDKFCEEYMSYSGYTSIAEVKLSEDYPFFYDNVLYDKVMEFLVENAAK